MGKRRALVINGKKHCLPLTLFAAAAINQGLAMLKGEHLTRKPGNEPMGWVIRRLSWMNF
jgi:hypothetical protein